MVNYRNKVCFDFLNSFSHDTIVCMLLSTTQAGWTALLLAADEGNEEIVKYLLHSKANTEVKNKVRLGEYNIVMAQCSHTRTEKVTCAHAWSSLYTIDNCFDIQEGRTALLVACWRGFLPIVDMLLKSGANTDAQDQVQCTYMQCLYQLTVISSYAMST